MSKAEFESFFVDTLQGLQAGVSGSSSGNGGGHAQNHRQIFATIDTDGDGVISAENFVAFHTASGQNSADEIQQLFESGDLDGSGDLTLDELRTQLEDIDAREKCGPDPFCFMDRNEDGFLTEDELQRSFRGSVPPEFWDSEDHDGDRRISRQEFDSNPNNQQNAGGASGSAGAQSSRDGGDRRRPTGRDPRQSPSSDRGGGYGYGGGSAAATPQPDGGEITGIVDNIFLQTDTNDDGVIDEAEFLTQNPEMPDARAVFGQGDRNQDGVVSREELAATIREEQQRAHQ